MDNISLKSREVSMSGNIAIGIQDFSTIIQGNLSGHQSVIC